MVAVDVLFLPSDAKADSFRGKAVAVFDVLRATTTMTAALASGLAEIRLFDSIDAARKCAGEATSDLKPMLCGERECLRPEGFDFGNSPGDLVRDRREKRSLYMCTTNGTKAILAAREAGAVFVAALVNAKAAARALLETGLDVTLLCAGTNGEAAIEDVIGAGAVIAAMEQERPPPSPPPEYRGREKMTDRALIARGVFEDAKHRLRDALASGAGGRNVLAAGLEADVDFAASLNRFRVVGRVVGGTRVTL
jgi:2-phosphosulfolactate phosphatase